MSASGSTRGSSAAASSSRGSIDRPFRGAAGRRPGFGAEPERVAGRGDAHVPARVCLEPLGGGQQRRAGLPDGFCGDHLGQSGGFGRRGPAAGGRGGPDGDQIDPDDHQRGA